MEINLEIPLREQERLDTGSPADVVEHSVDGLHVEEELHFPTSGHDLGVFGPDVNEKLIGNADLVYGKAVGADFVNKGAICEPQNGMEFDSKEEAYSFYREYARSVGFGITIKASRRSKKSGKFIDVKIACSRFGSKRESDTIVNPRSCPKTDCKASMHMKRREDEKWFIYMFEKEHNHDMCLDDFYYTIKGGKKQSTAVACQKKGLQLALDKGDVQLMLDYFICMQAENPNFFYAIDLDNENRLRNVLWIEAKSRHDYNNFCDVVFFDTFFLQNKYKIPVVPVIGVNHHLQFMLLGCALIGQESTSSFVWLMRTWLKAVGNQAPRVIITDQDKSLKEAVTDIFPDSCHCFCLWHVFGKIPEILDDVINQNEDFVTEFKKCIYRSWTDEQFESRWWEMIDEFRLRGDGWLQSLYEDRKKWIPTYMKDIFLAGMSTTERSLSIASFFDKYMHVETAFNEFLEQYKTFLKDSYEMESKADMEMRHRQPTLISLFPIEKQMSTVYTGAAFKKFQVEVCGVVSCHVEKESQDEATIVFRVDDYEDRQDFIVAWKEEELDISCSCRSFQYRGFLCRHAILVLQRSGVSNIPSVYILKRLTKDAKMSRITEISNGHRYRVHRFNDLCKRAIKLGEEGCLSKETYTSTIHALEQVLKHCVSVNNSFRSISDPIALPVRGLLYMEEENHNNTMVKSSKKNRTHKKRKIHLETEVMNSGAQDSCQQMDLGSRAANLDGYYGSQQSMHRAGQLNPMSPIRDGYYSNERGMQGHGQLHSVATSVGHFGTQQQSIHGPLQGQNSFIGPTMHGLFEIQDSLEAMEQSAGSSQFHGITSKHLSHKHHS